MGSSSKPALGWREWLALPELEISAIQAKVDTGARSSSIHAENIEYFKRGRVAMVRFVVGDIREQAKLRRKGNKPCELPLLEIRTITSSNGTRQKRPIVRTVISLGEQEWEIDVSLTPRSTMGFPMLLGREAIRGRFVVDPGRSFRARGHIPKKKKA